MARCHLAMASTEEDGEYCEPGYWYSLSMKPVASSSFMKLSS